jgi:hypothetical protein
VKRVSTINWYHYTILKTFPVNDFIVEALYLIRRHYGDRVRCLVTRWRRAQPRTTRRFTFGHLQMNEPSSLSISHITLA